MRALRIRGGAGTVARGRSRRNERRSAEDSKRIREADSEIVSLRRKLRDKGEESDRLDGAVIDLQEQVADLLHERHATHEESANLRAELAMAMDMIRLANARRPQPAVAEPAPTPVRPSRHPQPAAPRREEPPKRSAREAELERELSKLRAELTEQRAQQQRAADLDAQVQDLTARLRAAEQKESGLRSDLRRAERMRGMDQEKIARLEASVKRVNLVTYVGGLIATSLIAEHAPKAAKDPSAATTSPPAAPASEAVPAPPNAEQMWKERVRDAQKRGWVPLADRLVRLKREELQQEDTLGLHQKLTRKPVTARMVPPGVNIGDLAMRAALEARWAYYEAPSPERQGKVRWEQPWRLDSESEAELIRRTEARIEELRRQLKG